MSISEKTIRAIDKAQMSLRIQNLYQQFETEFVTLNSRAKISKSKTKNIVVTGLGGSAIGGDLMRAYLSEECDVPILVNRNYALPAFVNSSSLVIVSSYSGNTEETISAYQDAMRRKAQIVCITSGGKVEELALTHRHYLVKIPAGAPPRAAIGYLFAPMLETLAKFGFIADKKSDIAETAQYLKEKSRAYADFKRKGNLAVAIAKKCYGKLPIIYASDDVASAVAARWKGQICENAKTLAYANVFPELNHNELVGWNQYPDLLKRTVVIMLHDEGDRPRNAFRMRVTKSIVKKCASSVIDVESEGKSLLARLFSLILLGDWVSYYLAILNGVDPTPVEAIDFLKQALSKFNDQRS
ncbi:MAG: bifunctional phosphoglucose/phosphomannose isomerase [Chloroherpetonaceae bacterium]|nr:bifunctional phosphoglucose/phosphomannose isomerase [Chloroherpetonaceae bacterium]MDW8438533.1 bifunctional phosphoglucose/phosphomannose isomerase [Chloroherpetonaceae bacterium]